MIMRLSSLLKIDSPSITRHSLHPADIRHSLSASFPVWLDATALAVYTLVCLRRSKWEVAHGHLSVARCATSRPVPQQAALTQNELTSESVTVLILNYHNGSNMTTAMSCLKYEKRYSLFKLSKQSDGEYCVGGRSGTKRGSLVLRTINTSQEANQANRPCRRLQYYVKSLGPRPRQTRVFVPPR